MCNAFMDKWIEFIILQNSNLRESKYNINSIQILFEEKERLENTIKLKKEMGIGINDLAEQLDINETKISSNNYLEIWNNHPDIIKIREFYAAIDELQNRQKTGLVSKEDAGEEGQNIIERYIFYV